MPLKPGKSQEVVSENIRELFKGPQFQKTSDKFGKKKAQKQAVAIALKESRKSGPMPRPLFHKGD